MTTIILVIIGILIAAAAALMMVFYGGDAFNDSNAEAEAATLISHGTQISAAFDLYRVENGKYPGDANGDGALDDLVDAEYLDQIPQAPSGRSFEPGWKVDYSRGVARSTLGAVDDDAAALVCTKARQKMGFEGPTKSCDDPTIAKLDPCCTMSASDL